MNKKILFTLSATILASVIVPVLTLAQQLNNSAGTNGQPCSVILKFVTIFEEVGAAIVIIGWIITGVLYLTAMGDPGKAKTAKGALIACVIGTAVIILAPAAYTFVNSALSLGDGTDHACSATGA